MKDFLKGISLSPSGEKADGFDITPAVRHKKLRPPTKLASSELFLAKFQWLELSFEIPYHKLKKELAYPGGVAALLLSVFAGWATKVSVFSILLATTFSIVVGIGFGLWPARQAAGLNPIEALRYE